MKTLYYLGLLGLCVANNAMGKTGSNASGPQTDIHAADSVKLYAEEAQRKELIKDTKVIFANGGDEVKVERDSIESMIAKFYEDQFRNSQDPESPYFLLMSKDANLVMGIGGVVNVSGWFDWNGMIQGADFNTYNIPIPGNVENRKQLAASAAGTSLFFNIMGRHSALGSYRGYFEAGFSGYNHKDFKLKKAYFQIWDLTVGLAKTTFSDPAAQPDVLDPAGANGKISKSNVLVRYMHTWKNKWSFAGSVEFPSSQITTTEGETSKLPDYTPDVAALGQFQWNRGMSHVRLTGVIRNIPYRDLITEKNKNVLGWGLQLSSVVRAGRVLTFYGTGSVGRGIASYSGDLSNGDFDLLPSPGNAGDLYAPTTVSVVGGAKVQITPKLSSNVCLSTLRHFAKDGLSDDTYKYGQYLAVNAIYNFSPRLQAGLEYLAGKRMNFNGEKGNANRLLASFTFAF